jgi:hypothetical protein
MVSMLTTFLPGADPKLNPEPELAPNALEDAPAKPKAGAEDAPKAGADVEPNNDGVEAGAPNAGVLAAPNIVDAVLNMLISAAAYTRCAAAAKPLLRAKTALVAITIANCLSGY